MRLYKQHTSPEQACLHGPKPGQKQPSVWNVLMVELFIKLAQNQLHSFWGKQNRLSLPLLKAKTIQQFYTQTNIHSDQGPILEASASVLQPTAKIGQAWQVTANLNENLHILLTCGGAMMYGHQNVPPLPAHQQAVFQQVHQWAPQAMGQRGICQQHGKNNKEVLWFLPLCMLSTWHFTSHTSHHISKECHPMPYHPAMLRCTLGLIILGDHASFHSLSTMPK